MSKRWSGGKPGRVRAVDQQAVQSRETQQPSPAADAIAPQTRAATYTVTVSGVMDSDGTLIVKGSGDSLSWKALPGSTVASASGVSAAMIVTRGAPKLVCRPWKAP